MEKFIVSARKYRPQNFGTVVGQQHITTTLKNAIRNNQLAHAFLFCGPRGVGKTTCARILAKTINCEKRSKDGEACNKCNSCVSFDNGTSFNIHELDAASNNGVDDIRALVEQVRFAPQAGKYKVYIIDEVHMLSSQAFNAFLKTLEEPPPYAIFILATTEKHKILPTILSRCQIFDFKRITLNDTVTHLKEICEKEGIEAENAALHVIAQKSEGCLRDALSILDKIVSFTNGKLIYSTTLEHLNLLDEDYYFRLLDFMQQQQLSNALLLFDEINQKGFEGDTLLEGFAEFLRNVLVSKDPKAAILLEVAEDFKERYIQAANKADSGWLLSALNVLNDSSINFRLTKNKRLHVELTLIKLSYLHQALEIISEDKTVQKKKQTGNSSPVSFRALPIIKIKEGEIVSSPKPVKASLVIDTPSGNVKKEKKNEAPPPAVAGKPVTNEPATPSGILVRIRNSVTEKNSKTNETRLLNPENLNKAWQAFVEKLEEKKNHSSAAYFRMAIVSSSEENCIAIEVESNFHLKFIEAERSDLIIHLQEFFYNRLLTYRVNVNATKTPEETEKVLNKKEQFQILVAEFPAIKDLKDRLRLELDY